MPTAEVPFNTSSCRLCLPCVTLHCCQQAGKECQVCEEPCSKPRPEGCKHDCPLPCHPGMMTDTELSRNFPELNKLSTSNLVLKHSIWSTCCVQLFQCYFLSLFSLFFQQEIVQAANRWLSFRVTVAWCLFMCHAGTCIRHCFLYV